QSMPSEAIERIWGEGRVRIFLSHKAEFKEQTAGLKAALLRCGIVSFVAHEDIEPAEEWQPEIERALFSMDALVALLTANFHDSNWTDQEVGVAIGRGIPVIGIQLGCVPYGLLGKSQALGGCTLSRPEEMAAAIFGVLYRRLPDKSRLFDAALTAYSASTTWHDSAWKVQNLFTRFESLSEEQVNRLMAAYNTNVQNSNSFDGMDALNPLLNKWTGKTWIVQNNRLVQSKPLSQPSQDDEIPF
ncbi:MAG TPA: toll/interleukin-1 receptor domain-containing protein, partial [Oligoflexia bacterium]|nr:toll/interleukin-1 receptor domain-containing protein [Oligoflexia bacterium]